MRRRLFISAAGLSVLVLMAAAGSVAWHTWSAPDAPRAVSATDWRVACEDGAFVLDDAPRRTRELAAARTRLAEAEDRAAAAERSPIAATASLQQFMETQDRAWDRAWRERGGRAPAPAAPPAEVRAIADLHRAAGWAVRAVRLGGMPRAALRPAVAAQAAIDSYEYRRRWAGVLPDPAAAEREEWALRATREAALAGVHDAEAWVVAVHRSRSPPVWYAVPHVTVIGLAAVLPGLWLARWLRTRPWRRRRRTPGLCRRCGYDLRATPGRCPECWAVPSTPARPV